ncbi:olfactomedin-like protein 3A isoform X2 [Alosa sapidissima]|uniref:olfactomedin-like protein 3A isoform X1 n=2 Tax=Alosa sapidissima TaxID=34773 RepID=UPI001C08EEF4|nr:olfactomedin-like protein 3A isoform X1 [Alosa sapidissima]XP_041944530.1 olfactomedin-like protein 3A isoform X2 [Alosa sapidissima]
MKPVLFVVLFVVLLGLSLDLAAAQQQALMDYLERRLQAIEDRISLWHEQTTRYAAELREVKQQMVSQLEVLDKRGEGLRSELDGLGSRVGRVEREMDYLDTQKETQPCVDVDERLVEQQVTVARERTKLKYAKLSGCKDVMASVKGMKVLKRLGGSAGMWTKDMTSGVGGVYVFNGSSSDTLHQFSSVRDFTSSQGTALATPLKLPGQWSGTGHAVYQGHAYYMEDSAELRLLKVSLTDGALADSSVLPLPDLVPAYALTPDTYVDLAVDEEGLWAIYATRESQRHLSLAKMDAGTLAVMQLWTTPCPRENAEAAFVVCGALHVVYNSRLPGRSRVQCVYDVGDLQPADEAPLAYFPRRQGAHSSMKYSPHEKLLYAWDQGYQILYKLTMKNKLEV